MSGIAVGVWWNIALLVGSLGAMPFDHRTILGLNPWIKPVKFEISVIVFLITIGILLRALGQDGNWPKSRRWLGWGFAIAMIVENSVIVLQAARGVRSHMNYTTAWDGILFGLMGLFIALNSIFAAWLLLLWFMAKTDYKRAVVWGVRLGLIMLLAASAEGVRMVSGGGHTVGAPDGGPGLFFLNWSSANGDLRIAHFFGLHALQAFPLAGLLFASTHWREQLQVIGLFAFAAIYASVVWWLFAQAVQGLPIG